MEFRVTMKDPDTLDDAIQVAIRREVAKIEGLDAREREAVEEERREKVGSLCARWFEYGEYLTVQIDTEAGTCVVVPCK
jgi:hypothetical protein